MMWNQKGDHRCAHAIYKSIDKTRCRHLSD